MKQRIWERLTWPLMLIQLVVVFNDFFQLAQGKNLDYFYLHSFFLLCIVAFNVQYLFTIDTDEAFNLLNIGNILDRRYVGFYFKVILSHWRILYYSIGFSVSFFLLVESFHRLNYFEIVGINSFLLAIFQRAPLYIRRQKFFNKSHREIKQAQQATILSIIDNRLVCQERLRAKRGIKQIYDAIVGSESTIMEEQIKIGTQLQFIEWLTNPKLQYFTIIRYAVTWILTNVILRGLVQYR